MNSHEKTESATFLKEFEERRWTGSGRSRKCGGQVEGVEERRWTGRSRKGGDKAVEVEDKSVGVKVVNSQGEAVDR